MTGRKYRWKCCTCGNNDLEANGAAWWSVLTQEWVWEWNDTYCPQCGDLVDCEMEVLPPEIPFNTRII